MGFHFARRHPASSATRRHSSLAPPQHGDFILVQTSP
jgi:hypothetical protein